MLHKIHVNHLVFLGFFLVMWGVVIFSRGAYEDVFLSVFLLVCCVIALFAPQLKHPVMHPVRSEDGTIIVRKFNVNLFENMFIKLETKISILAKIRMFNEKLITSLIFRTGRNFDPEAMATKMTRITFAVTVPALAAGLYIGITLDAVFLAICAVPLIVFFQPYLKLRIVIMERKTKVEEEMAYFLCYVNIMQTIGLGLYHAFDEIRGQNVFTMMERDASEIIKRVKMLGITQNESLATYANTHPSELFRNFVSGYVAKITSVGNVPGYTAEKASYFFEEYTGLWNRYEKSAQEIFSAIMMIAIILPMMIMFASILGTPETAGILLLMGTVISPFVSFAMIIMLNSSQPVTGNKINTSVLGPIAGVVVGVTTLLAGVDPGTAIASGFLVGSIVNIMMTNKKINEIKIIDSMLPEFMADVTELSKTGDNIGVIIQKQSKKHAYKKQFNLMLEEMAAQLSIGKSFGEVTKSIRYNSMNIKFIMFLLAKTYSTGGGTPEIFHSIAEFATRIYQAKSSVTKSLKSLSMIVYASPFLMLGIAHMMIAMFSGSLGPETTSGDLPPIGNYNALDDRFINGIGAMAALSSIPIGFIASKISSYTVKDTLPVAIVSFSTILAIHILPPLIAISGFGT